jgi:hypothetical protein
MARHLLASSRLGLLGIIAALMSSALSCVSITLDGGPVATPTFLIESLLLDESAFPEGWTAYEPGEPQDGFGLRVGIHYSPPAPSAGGIALNAAYVARSPEEAADGYEIWAPFWFSDSEGWSEWRAPDESRYQSSIADQYRFACSREEGDSRQVCQAVGQYGRYMIRFHTFMNPETMTPSDLERILMIIDDKMELHLGQDAE